MLLLLFTSYILAIIHLIVLPSNIEFFISKGIVIFSLFLPNICANLLQLKPKFYQNKEIIRIIKLLNPYNKFFIKAWKSTIYSKERLFYLSIEPHAIEYNPVLYKIIGVWIDLGIISELSLIDIHYRNQYKYLSPQHQEDKDTLTPPNILEIEKITKGRLSISFNIRTLGKVTGEELVSSKAKIKLYELFALTNLPLRSINYDKNNRKITLQFFLQHNNSEIELIKLTQKIEIAFTEIGVHNKSHNFPELISHEIIDSQINKDTNTEILYSVKFRYSLPTGLSLEFFTKKKIELLASYIRKPIYKHKSKAHEDLIEFYIEVNKRPLHNLSYTSFKPANKLRVPIGFDLNYRKAIYLNLEESQVQTEDAGHTPHIMISGITGSGKSNFIKFLLINLLRGHTPNSLRLFLVDPKVVTFSPFKKSPFLYAPIVSKADKFKLVLDGIINEVEKRYKLLAEYGCENISGLEKSAPKIAQNLPRILVVIDEFADIIDSQNWKRRDSINLILKRLGQKARAAGVHLILITQRATSQNIDAEIKANINGRIVFKVSSEADSMIMINEPIAEQIENPGEGYAALGDNSELSHFQCPYISEEEIKYELNKFHHYPQNFIDTNLSQEIEKIPLTTDQITLENFPVPQFPNIPIGINLNSHKVHTLKFEPFQNNLDEVTPHIIIAGATNAGKSQFAKLLAYQLIQSGTPDDLKLILIDPKAVSFTQFQNSPHLACPIIQKHYLFLPILQVVLKEIEKRYNLFSKHYVENINEYREKTNRKMPSYFLIIDEFADLLDYFSYKERDIIEKILKRYGQMARAAGIHMVILTQRATSQNIPSELKANFGGKMAFRVHTEADSNFILENSGAENLAQAGMYLLRKLHHIIEKGYAPLIDRKTIQQLMKKNIKTYQQPHFHKDIIEAIKAKEKEISEDLNSGI